MTRHVGTDVLASYREGEVGRRRSARIRRHLADCARCAGIDANLAAVTSVLADVQLPGIPDHLAARLQGALAAEVTARVAKAPAQTSDQAVAGGAVASGAAASQAAASQAGSADEPVAVPGRPDLPERGRRQRQRRGSWVGSPLVLRSLAAAGVVVVVAAGGYLLTSGSSVSGSGSTASGPGASRPYPKAAVPRPAFGSVGLPYNTRQGGVGIATAIRSRVNFRPATLAAQVRREIADIRTPSVVGAGTANSPVTHSPLAQPRLQGIDLPVLEACVSLVAAGREVLLVDVARYEGDPATVIVTAASATATRLRVSVVGGACSAARSDLLTRVTISR